MAKYLSGVLNMKPEETSLALLSTLFHFCVLCGYFFLRPVRDAMGVSGGMDDLRWLFVVTSIISLILVLAFGGVVTRTNRRRFIPIAYLFVIVCLVGFAALLIVDAASGGGFIGSEAGTGVSRLVGYVFFVWLSAINLFVTSVFWAFMVDIFGVDQGKRLFAFIGIGGTLGALVGWYIWAFLTFIIGTRLLPEPQTEADIGQLLRTTGFSAAPGVIRAFGLVPGLGAPAMLIGSFWMLVAMVIAVRQALDYRGTGRG